MYKKSSNSNDRNRGKLYRIVEKTHIMNFRVVYRVVAKEITLN